MATKMVQLRETVYRRLKKQKAGRSFSDVIEELLDYSPTTDGDEILRRAVRWEGKRLFSKRASPGHKRPDQTRG